MITRFFTIEQEHLIYYKSQTSLKAKGLIHLYQCKPEVESSHNGQTQKQLWIKISTLNNNVIWVFPKHEAEFEFMQKYILFICSGNLRLKKNG